MLNCHNRLILSVSLLSALLLGVPAAWGTGAGEEGSADRSAQELAALDAARAHVAEHLAELGLRGDDVAELPVSDLYTSRINGVTHVYLHQHRNGIPVRNALINVNVLPSGRVLNAGNRAFADLSAHRLAEQPTISALEAVGAAADAAGLAPREVLVEQSAPAGDAMETLFSDGGISLEPIPARLVYAPDAKDRLRLTWRVDIYQRDAQHYWVSWVDAETGEIVEREDRVVHDQWGPGDDDGHGHAPSAGGSTPMQAGSGAVPAAVADGSSYRVYDMPKGHPDDGPRTLVEEPAHAPASPFGWHDTDGLEGAEHTITRGNNAHAYHDRNNTNSSSGDEPDGGPGLDFDFALDLADGPEDYIDAAVTNLFYWNNLHHDLIYARGFDEAAGNFQVDNYGNGGAGGDDVRAEAQDGGGMNNANFFTPSDGSRPRMQMFLWNQTSPNRDGDLDAGIVLHEYGHGISIRQTGGPSQSGCLSNAEQAGEGWSDWQTIVYTVKPGDTRTTSRGVGTYVLGQPVDGPGIREYPYNTDMGVDPRTYADTQSASVPHGVGSIWTAMLWEVYWNLVDEHGFNPDFYADWDAGGNLLAMQLVNDGLKLQTCSPGFVDARDAILAADDALTGGANQCLIWEGFAKRGLGFSADQGSSGSNGDNTEAFDMPPSCDLLHAPEPVARSCTGDPVDFEIDLGGAWEAPVNLSVSGQPGTAQFDPNPASASGTSVMTVSGTSGEPAGSYAMTVTGDDGTMVEQIDLDLELFDAAPDEVTPDLPADGATDVAFRPELSWQAAAGTGTYLVEVASDPAFDDVVYSVETTDTQHRLASALAAETTHYWRVQAGNPCGDAASSPVRSFETAASSLVCGGVVDFESGIPGDWTVTDDSASGSGIVWTTSDDPECGIDNRTSGSGIAACADSDAAGQGAPAFDTSLITPPIDLSAADSASMEVATYFREISPSVLSIDVFDGADWNEVWSTTSSGTADVPIDLTAYLGQANVQVRMRYSGDGWDWYAQVDDVSLDCEISSVPPSIAVDRSEIELRLDVAEEATTGVNISNPGGENLDWTAAVGSDCNTPAGLPWANLSTGSGSTPGGDTSTLDVTLDGAAAGPGGHGGMLCIESNDPDNGLIAIPLLLEVAEDALFGDCFGPVGEGCP